MKKNVKSRRKTKKEAGEESGICLVSQRRIRIGGKGGTISRWKGWTRVSTVEEKLGCL